MAIFRTKDERKSQGLLTPHLGKAVGIHKGLETILVKELTD